MAVLEAQSQANRTSSTWQNVRGWERLLSIAGGLVLAACGAGKTGSQGNRQLSIGSMLLMRGLSGHCSVKSAIDDPLEEIRYLRERVQRLQELVLMAEQLAERSAPAQAEPTDTALDLPVSAPSPRYAQNP